MSDIFSGLAEGFSAGQQQRSLREQLGMQQDERKYQRGRDVKADARADAQEKRLQEHQTFMQGVEKQKQLVQAREADVKTLETMFKVFDPKFSAPVRKMMLQQMAPTLGIDPQTQEYKNWETLVGKLDADELTGMKEALLAAMPSMEPGAVNGFAKAILSGKMTLEGAMKHLQEAAKTKTREKVFGAGPSSASPEGTPAGENGDPPGTAPAGTAPDGTSAEWRQKARQLFASGDDAGGKSALDMAKQIDDAAKEGADPAVEEVLKDGKRVFVRRRDAVGLEPAPKQPLVSMGDQKDVVAYKMQKEIDDKRALPELEKARKAQDMNRGLEVYTKALKTGKFVTGPAADIRATAGRVIEFFGGDPTKVPGIGSPAAAEVMESSINDIGLQLADRLSRLTNVSLEYAKTTVPALWKTPGGNALIAEFIKAVNDQDVRVGDLYEEYISKYGTLRPEGKLSFFQEADRIRSEPVVGEDFKQKLDDAVKGGEGVDLRSLVVGDAEQKNQTIKLGDKTLPITGTKDGLSTVRMKPLKGGAEVDLPLVYSIETAKNKLKPGDMFVIGTEVKIGDKTHPPGTVLRVPGGK